MVVTLLEACSPRSPAGVRNYWEIEIDSSAVVSNDKTSSPALHTASTLLMLDFVNGSHTVDAYSSCGLLQLQWQGICSKWTWLPWGMRVGFFEGTLLCCLWIFVKKKRFLNLNRFSLINAWRAGNAPVPVFLKIVYIGVYIETWIFCIFKVCLEW